ncbi:MAG: hypothetical protein QM811_18780 [Pirellulales bacterium]
MPSLKHLSLLVLAALAPYSLFVHGAHAQAVDRDEIVRRGDRVEHVDAYAFSDGDPLAPPADDSHKWFVTLLTQPGCAPCKTLLTDLATRDELRAFVDPGDMRRSWAHFNRYSSADESQHWRWKHVAIAGYPTLLIQPPLNGRYGDPKQVVLQKTGYDGDAKKLAGQLRDAIETHAREHVAPRTEIVTELTASIAPSTAFTAPRATPPFAPPALPDALPAVLPAPLVVPPSVDPDAKTPEPAPRDESSPQPQTPPDAQTFPQHPEAVVIVDKYAESMADDAVFARLRGVLKKLRGDRPGLIVRYLDLRDAARYPVTRDELPAIVTTNEGRIETKLDRTLLPLVGQTGAFPWDALVELLTKGFNWAGAAAIGVWLIRTVREFRKARGQTLLLDDATLQKLRDVLGVKS